MNEKKKLFYITKVDENELINGKHFDKMEKWKKKMMKRNKEGRKYAIMIAIAFSVLIGLSFFNALGVLIILLLGFIIGLSFIIGFLILFVIYGAMIGEEPPTLEEIT